jgi:nucleotide-binding universal stress UspA family protein
VSWPEFLADLAQFEWTFSVVFDGPGVEGKEILDEAKLRAVPPERWPDARLTPVPCLRLLTVRFPVQAYYAAVRNDEAPEMPAPAETRLALTRRDYIVRHSTLDGLEYRLLTALVEGKSVADAIEQVAQTSGADLDHLAANLHEWFRHWAASGFFQGMELPKAAESRPG